MKNSKSLKPIQDKIIIRTALVCLLGLGGFLVWGIAVPLEEGVAASGNVVVDGQRKVVQHLEGGIIDEIFVVEGERVEKGDVIVALKDVASLASRDQTIQEYASLAASIDRLQALLTNGERPKFSVLEKLDLGKQERADVIERELDLFDQQQSALSADIAVLMARRDAVMQTQKSRKQQISIVQRSLATARDELEVIKSMYEQQLARRDQYTSSQRQAVSLESEIANLRSELVDASSAEQDLNAQIQQVKAQSSQQLTATLLETRAKLLSAEEKLNASQDILDRSVIKAPVTGKVLNMHFATIGGVVRPGETIMEIIPNVGEVTATVKIRPADRASVFEEQTVRTQVSAYKGWQAPSLQGRIVDISADLKTDPATSSNYYEARVLIPAEEMQRVQNIDVIPGMPVDVFIYSGRSRTMFDYLFEPLGESIFRGLRSS